MAANRLVAVLVVANIDDLVEIIIIAIAIAIVIVISGIGTSPCLVVYWKLECMVWSCLQLWLLSFLLSLVFYLCGVIAIIKVFLML